MSMLDRRLQVLINEERWERLTAEAERRQVPVAVLVREALDQVYPSDFEERRAALRRALAAEKMPVPGPEELRRELDEIRGGRFG
jgi:hypothetical protein